MVIASFFSHPSKEHGFLVAKTFFEPESVFRIAKVGVLKHQVAVDRPLGGDLPAEGEPDAGRADPEKRLIAPSVPVAPGSDVERAGDELLAELLGEGELELGAVLHHPHVPVRLRTRELLTKHTAVLGMTGAGKSNAVKVLLRNLLRLEEFQDLRVAVIDTHGEYAAAAEALAGERGWTDLAVEVGRSLMEEGEFKEEALKKVLRLGRKDSALFAQLQELADTLSDDDDLPEFCRALRDAAQDEGDEESAEAPLHIRTGERLHTNTMSTTEASNKLAQLVDQVQESHEPVRITSEHGDAVLISANQWRAVQETLHLLSIRGMRESIAEGIAMPPDGLEDKLDW